MTIDKAPVQAPTRFGPEAPPAVERSSRSVPIVAGVLGVVVVLACAGWLAGAGPADEAGEVPVLAAPGVQDDFTRAEDPSPLGNARTGQPWDEVTGSWSVMQGELVIDEPHEVGARTLAVVDLGSADGAVSVTAAHMISGFGVVFRYQDPFNYWFLTSAPDFGTWKVQQVVEGELVDLGGVGLFAAADGTTVDVRFVGRTISVFVDGVLAREVADPTFQDQTIVGVLAEGEHAGEARFDDFVAVPEGGAATTSSASVSPP